MENDLKERGRIFGSWEVRFLFCLRLGFFFFRWISIFFVFELFFKRRKGKFLKFREFYVFFFIDFYIIWLVEVSCRVRVMDFVVFVIRRGFSVYIRL